LLLQGNSAKELLPEIAAKLTMIELQHVRMHGLAQQGIFYLRQRTDEVLVCQ